MRETSSHHRHSREGGDDKLLSPGYVILNSLRYPLISAWLAAGALAAWCAAAPAASLRDNPEVDAFIEQLAVDHSFDRRQLRRWFNQARVQGAVLQAIARPGTARPWREFRASHVTEARIRGGVDYWLQYADALAHASSEYGVPEEIIVATIGIETFYGRNAGKHIVFDALATLAFAYPPRAELFRGELEQFLLLARELRTNPLSYKGSYAGALGVPQFLPSSYRRYAVDFDGNGKRDLWDHRDAIGSIANYYKNWGWRPGERVIVALEQPVEPAGDAFKTLLERGLNPHSTVAAIRSTGVAPDQLLPDDELASVFAAETDAGTRYWLGFNNFYVITRYNRSVNYALAVHELALELRRARYAATFE